MEDHRAIMLDGLCRALDPRHIVLIGARDAAFAALVLAAAMRAGATLHVVSAAPGDAAAALRETGRDACIIHQASAADALKLIPVPELCWVDADPNYTTVRTALNALEAQAVRRGKPFPVTIVESAGWPHGRRDGYDDPASIPAPSRHPHERAGLIPGQAWPAGSAGLHADRFHASAENEPRNGVLTAVEDFLDGRTGALRVELLPGFGGRAVVTPRAGAGKDAFGHGAHLASLQALAQALEDERLRQAVALADRDGELQRAQALAALLRRPEPASVSAGEIEPGSSAVSAVAALVPPALRQKLRPVARLAMRLRHGVGGQDQDGASVSQADAARLRASPIFDAAWYVTAYPDVAVSGHDPALHYIQDGAAELRDPGPFFSTRAYLAANPDVAETGINPVLHYLASGAAEGRSLGGEFDAPAYLRDVGDAAAQGTNPLEHFIASRRQGGTAEIPPASASAD